MGEALITRRGGSVKAGFVGCYNESVQCDDWIGAKNITLTCGAYLPSIIDRDDLDVHGAIVMVRVVNGDVHDVWCFDDGSLRGITDAPSAIWFDSSTGTISVPGDRHEWFVRRGFSGEDFEYEYVVY